MGAVEPKKSTVKGPPEWFTGDVWIDSLAEPNDVSMLNVGAVHFTPGARTAWHSHDGGQTLVVLKGEGSFSPGARRSSSCTQVTCIGLRPTWSTGTDLGTATSWPISPLRRVLRPGAIM